jgi:hypothetical protein
MRLIPEICMCKKVMLESEIWPAEKAEHEYLRLDAKERPSRYVQQLSTFKNIPLILREDVEYAL